MSNAFTSGKFAIAECDRCSKRVKLTTLKQLIVKLKPTGLYVCNECWEPDHPQLQLGMYPVVDPQAVRNPRPDLAIETSRNIYWGWNPVGGNLPAAQTQLGTVTVLTS